MFKSSRPNNFSEVVNPIYIIHLPLLYTIRGVQQNTVFRVIERVLIFVFFRWFLEENNDRYGFSTVMALLLLGCLCVFSRFDVLKYHIFRKEI